MPKTLSLAAIRTAGAAALNQIDANERDLENLPREAREHLRTLNEGLLKLSELYGMSIEISADASHPHEGFRSAITMVKEWNPDGARRLVWSTNLHISSLG